ncbi:MULTISPECIES: ABC transporter permease [Streptomyces]|uniref:ABC transporter permease n=1 Tax=Streptomyces lycii TaxID=2654337 RepID=A0ABQ7FG02_9ACTN|nr:MULTISPECIES: ABC transporter permease [Streptomyces]KAF4407463.1 ABC transporter permease [Streptomyces lycii]PGH48367.1 ABC transporter permease [Streptomyces sp. Ru87]
MTHLRTAGPAGDARPRTAADPRPRFRDLLAAEWRKTWAPRSAAWTYAVGALVVIAVNAGAAWDRYSYWHEMDARSRADFIRDGISLWDAFTGNASITLMLIAGAVGVLAVTGEYGTGLIRTTFAAVPARRSVMAAKAAVVAAATTGLGAVVAGTSFALTQAILSGRGAGVSIGHPGALRLVVASALVAPVSALTGMAVGAVIRHTAGALTTTFGLLVVPPLVFGEDQYATAVVNHALPTSAWHRLAEVGVPQEVAYPWTRTGGWIVYAAWACAAVLVAVTVVHRRDQ